jgi:hypothetical protein
LSLASPTSIKGLGRDVDAEWLVERNPLDGCVKTVSAVPMLVGKVPGPVTETKTASPSERNDNGLSPMPANTS